MAYTSDESGRPEVSVQDFPATGAKYQVSTGGGSEARWRGDGRELFYLGADGWMMSVSVEGSPGFELGVPRPMFQTRLLQLPLTPQRRFHVSAEGNRFLMNIPVDGHTVLPITVMVNWVTALNGR